MTALTQYQRLDSVGRWQPAPGGAWREVGVSFGNATLVLTDDDGQPLAHWSLPAVRRVNPGVAPARFAPDAEGFEGLEVDDDLLVSAIERIGATVARARRPPRRGGRLVGAAVGAFVLGLGALWLPGAIGDQALKVLPPANRAEIGATMLGYLQRDLGPACRDPLGVVSLERLRDRVLGPGQGQAVVLPSGPAAPLALPGGLIVISRAGVEGAGEPAEVAAALVAAGAAQPDPLAGLLDRLGTIGTLRLLVTGEPEAEAVAAHAAALAKVPPIPDPGALVAAMAAAGLSAGPGEPLLTDGEWVSLQGICQS